MSKEKVTGWVLGSMFLDWLGCNFFEWYQIEEQPICVVYGSNYVYRLNASRTKTMNLYLRA